MLLLIIILLLVFGGGGGYYGYSRWGTRGGGGIGLGTILLILADCLCFGCVPLAWSVADDRPPSPAQIRS